MNTCGFLLLDLLRDAEDVITGGEVAGDTDDGVRCVGQDRGWTHGMILPPSPYLSAVVFRTSSRRPVMYTVAPFATSACVIWWLSQPHQHQRLLGVAYHETDAGSAAGDDGLEVLELEELGSLELRVDRHDGGWSFLVADAQVASLSYISYPAEP
jgi:hypothetical protein